MLTYAMPAPGAGPIRLLLAALLLAAAAAPAAARDTAHYYGFEPGTRFSLTVAHERFDFRVDGEDRAPTRVTRAEGSLVEPFATWFQPGIVLGGAVLSQQDNTVTAGLDPVLWLAGLTLDSDWALPGPLTLRLHGAALYHRTEAAEGEDTDGADADPDREVTLDWLELRLRALLRADLGAVIVTGGGYLLALEGDERLRGEERSTRDLSLVGSGGAYAELEVPVDRSGSIALAVEVGARDSMQVRFTRRF